MTPSELITPPGLTGTTLEKFDWNWRGYKIQYTVMGAGRPILLVHGFGANMGHWRKNIPAIAAGGYRVFAVDLLGFGGSDKPALEYCLELWEDLLKDFWTAHIQEPAVLIGNSIGGLLSLMVLAHAPQIAAGGILLNCAGGLNHRPDELNLPLRLIMSAFTKLVASPYTGPFLFNRIRQRHRIRRTLAQVYRNPEAITDELVELIYTPACDRDAQKVFSAILTAPPGPTPAELLPQVQSPLLVLWGEQDPWTPIRGAQIYQQAQTACPQATLPPVQLVPIPNTGHCPHDERPEVVNPLILDWLAQL